MALPIGARLLEFLFGLFGGHLGGKAYDKLQPGRVGNAFIIAVTTVLLAAAVFLALFY